MKELYQWMGAALLMGFMMLSAFAYSDVTYPYSNAQAIFVQTPFNSSLYTNYLYNPRERMSNRLPPFTTNQAVFMQQPYATAQQTVTTYPSTTWEDLPYTKSRYTTPLAYPSTVSPAYPYATTGNFVSSPYTTTNQFADYAYPYAGTNYSTMIDLYPFSTVTEEAPYTSPNQSPNGRPYLSSIYNTGFVTRTTVQYRYPTATTAVPEAITRPNVTNYPVRTVGGMTYYPGYPDAITK